MFQIGYKPKPGETDHIMKPDPNELPKGNSAMDFYSQVMGPAGQARSSAYDYYNKILAGDTDAMGQSAAPDINLINQQFKQAQSNIMGSAVARGGGLSRSLGQLESDRAFGVGQIIGRQRPEAASQLSSMSGADMQLGLGAMDLVQRKEEGALQRGHESNLAAQDRQLRERLAQLEVEAQKAIASGQWQHEATIDAERRALQEKLAGLQRGHETDLQQGQQGHESELAEQERILRERLTNAQQNHERALNSSDWEQQQYAADQLRQLQLQLADIETMRMREGFGHQSSENALNRQANERISSAQQRQESLTGLGSALVQILTSGLIPGLGGNGNQNLIDIITGNRPGGGGVNPGNPGLPQNPLPPGSGINPPSSYGGDLAAPVAGVGGTIAAGAGGAGAGLAGAGLGATGAALTPTAGLAAGAGLGVTPAYGVGNVAFGGGSAATGGGGFTGAVTGLMTNPITWGVGAAIAGIVGLVKSQAHHEANTWVQGFQNPFDQNMQRVNEEFKRAAQSGQLTMTDAISIRDEAAAAIDEYKKQLTEFEKGGSDEREVANNARRTFNQYYGEDSSKYMNDMDAFILQQFKDQWPGEPVANPKLALHGNTPEQQAGMIADFMKQHGETVKPFKLGGTSQYDGQINNLVDIVNSTDDPRIHRAAARSLKFLLDFRDQSVSGSTSTYDPMNVVNNSGPQTVRLVDPSGNTTSANLTLDAIAAYRNAGYKVE